MHVCRSGTNAVKIAGPIGLWAVREGFKAVWNFMSVMASESRRSKKGRLQEYEEWEDGRLQEYEGLEDRRVQEEAKQIGEEN